jgi:hypothetical protein
VQVNVWKDESAAWPVANPVLTCATVSDAGFPSNFVADPFLYVQVLILSVILDFLYFFGGSLSLSLLFSLTLLRFCLFVVFMEMVD